MSLYYLFKIHNQSGQGVSVRTVCLSQVHVASDFDPVYSFLSQILRVEVRGTMIPVTKDQRGDGTGEELDDVVCMWLTWKRKL